MIIYVATYPRSGNFWLQTLLGNQFLCPTSNIHEARQCEEARRRSKRNVKRLYNIDLFEAPIDELITYPPELAGWFLGYKIPGALKNSLFLADGCESVATKQEIRKVLAQDERYFFLKTHFMPYEEYFPGEYVIQLVRHPGATLWSYYNFKKDVNNKPKNLSMIIESDHWGNWSEYHQNWQAAAKILGNRYFLAKYEELAAGELEFCEKLSAFLRLPILVRELRPFDYYHKKRPSLTRQGTTLGWEQYFSKEQLRLLWKMHGEMMMRFGYSEPNYDLGLEKEEY